MCNWRKNTNELFEEDEDPIGEYHPHRQYLFSSCGLHKYVPVRGFESDGDILFLLNLSKNL